MPQPTKSAVHVDRPLTNISVAYAQTGNFVADRVFPRVPVSKQSDQYFTYTKADWLRSQAELRAPATESAGSGWTLGTDTYYARVRAIHKDIADQQRANQDSPLNLDADATRWITRQILMDREKDWSTTFFGAGIWDNEVTGVSGTPAAGQFQYWDEDGSDPIGDIDEQKITVMESTGYVPQIGVASPHVVRGLRNNADVIDRIKYTQQGVVTPGLLASLLDLDAMYIASAIEDTSTEGAATDSPGFIHGKHFLLAYAAPAPSLMEPSAGYTFVWTGLMGSVDGWQIKRFRMEHLEADRVEGQLADDQKVVASDVAVFFDGAVS